MRKHPIWIAVFSAMILASGAAPPLYGQTIGGNTDRRDQLIQLTGSSKVVGAPRSIVGHNPSVAASGGEIIWTAGGPKPFPPSALTITIQSDNAGDTLLGTGAQTVEIDCLDSTGVPFSQVVDMDGLSPVTVTAGDCFRIQRMLVISAGADPTNTNLGTITAENGGDVYEQIGVGPESGFGVSLSASWTVPSALRAGDSPHLVAIHDETLYGPEGTMTPIFILNKPGQATVRVPFHLGQQDQFFFRVCYPASTDIQAAANSGSGNVGVDIEFRVTIIDNTNSANPGGCVEPGAL